MFGFENHVAGFFQRPPGDLTNRRVVLDYQNGLAGPPRKWYRSDRVGMEGLFR